MQDVETAAAHIRPVDRIARRRRRTETIEAALIVALAGLVFFKGAPVVAAIALGIGEMIAALTRW